MSSESEPVCLAVSPHRLPIPAGVRAGIILIAWVPITYLLNFSLPGFVTIFERLQAKTELPALAQMFVWIGRINGDLYSIPIGILVFCLVLGDLGLPHVLGPSRARRWMHLFWFAMAAASGLIAIPAYFLAMQLPVFRLGQPVG